MNILRKIKISELLGKPLEGLDKEIVDFITDKISNLTEFTYDEKPDSIFYMSPLDSYKKDVCLFHHDLKDYKLYVRYRDFWGVLEDKYSLNYTDTQIIMKYLVEKVLKLKVSEIVSYFE